MTAETGFDENVVVIRGDIDRVHEENRRMKRLLSQVALFVACQPENAFRNRWLKEVEEINGG